MRSDGDCQFHLGAGGGFAEALTGSSARRMPDQTEKDWEALRKRVRKKKSA